MRRAESLSDWKEVPGAECHGHRIPGRPMNTRRRRESLGQTDHVTDFTYERETSGDPPTRKEPFVAVRCDELKREEIVSCVEHRHDQSILVIDAQAVGLNVLPL
jgi:hypothetical protein